MPTKFKILKRRMKPFQTDEGDSVDYYWYDSIRLEDNTKITFGSKDGSHEEGGTYDLLVLRFQSETDGKFRWKEEIQ